MYPAPSKEVPDSGVTAVNETARVPALQGSVSRRSLLKLVYTYPCLPIWDECVGVCDIAFSQGQDDYFPRSVLSILYSPCQTLNSLRAEFSIFLCIDQSPAKGPCFLPTPLCLGTACSWYCGKHILSVMIPVLADFVVSQSSPGIMEGRGLGTDTTRTQES